MILNTAQVENFKCIQDSGSFRIDAMTCLVGKNESGKSATLQALHRLKPEIDVSFHDVLDYPRNQWLQYRRERQENPANVLTTHWRLEGPEVQALHKLLGPRALTSREVVVRKGYDNVRRWEVAIDEAAVVKHYVAAADLYREEAEALQAHTSLETLIAALENDPDSSMRRRALLDQLQATFPQHQVMPTVVETLEDYLPTLLYFADYYTLRGQISIDKLLEKKQQGELGVDDRVFLALLDISGVTPEELYEIGEFEQLIAELEAVSGRLGEEVFKYWSQNRSLDVSFSLDAGRPKDPPPFDKGYVFRTRIRNRQRGITVSFDERSTGFVWFFSFLIWFSQVRKAYGENLIILLDEPGLNLHARAQRDLLDYIEQELAPNYQVLLSTHSPFLINTDKLAGVRTVEDVIEDGNVLGTKVGSRSGSRDPDTILPLQTAIGYHIARNLFADKTALLVENSSDLLYLNWFRRELELRERISLDPRWVITPTGGIAEMGSFIALFEGANSTVAALTSLAPDAIQHQEVESILGEANVISIAKYIDETEADVEDLMGWGCYADLINRSYVMGRNQRLPNRRPAAGKSVTLVNRHFENSGIDIAYNRQRPAEFLMQNTSKLRNNLAELEQALDNFAELFLDLNILLEENS